jgi:hypothetical protein
MNSAVALVEAYLHANGYFTVTEYPIMEALPGGAYRVATDIDIMAVRLPHAGRLIPGRQVAGGRGKAMLDPDPMLNTTDESVDLLIGEVKEGQAILNEGARDPEVLSSVLSRFGGKAMTQVENLVAALLKWGEAEMDDGPRVRVVAFGSHGAPRRSYHVITLGHILDFFRDAVQQHWGIMQQAHFKHPGLAFLMMEEKATRRQEESRRKRARRKRQR